jgi:triosephosphate isomerase (TIM)
VVVAPASLHIQTVRDTIRSDIAVSVQNSGKDTGYGAYTGELSPDMIKDFGLNWVITGHSERRVGFGSAGESSELVATKTKNAIKTGLNVMACVGESLDEREAGNTLKIVLDDHLAAIAKVLETDDWSKVVIAYEPVWAIGTGKTASPEQAQEVHAAIRNWVFENVSPEIAEAVRIIYGGSVKSSNAGILADCADIDGFLVGEYLLISITVTYGCLVFYHDIVQRLVFIALPCLHFFVHTINRWCISQGC